MKTLLRLSTVALLFALFVGNRAGAQTISGSGVAFNAGVSQSTIQQNMARYGASFNVKASMTPAGAGNGTIVVNFAPATYAGFVQGITFSAPNANGVVTATVTSVGYVTTNATGVKEAITCTAQFAAGSGSKSAMSLAFYNYPSGTLINQGTFNLLTGGVAVAKAN